MNNICLTSDTTLLNEENYKKVTALMNRLAQNGLIAMGTGYCISMSDLIYVSLKHINIPSRLVECQATVSYIDEQGIPRTKVIGYDGYKPVEGQIDTHVVVVTETIPPLIIDATIGYVLPYGLPVLVDKIEQGSNKILADLSYSEHGGLQITYQEKLFQKLPFAHQTSILDRIETDDKIFKEMSLLKRLNYIGIGVSIFALINVVIKVSGFW